MSNKNFEDHVRDVLNGDAQRIALSFAEFLVSNDMMLNLLEGNLWMAGYEGDGVCYIHLDGAAQHPGPWTVWTEGDYDSEPESFAIGEHTKELARAHANICGSCGGACSPGKRVTIFGKEIDNVCNAVMEFNNPDDKALECLKQLVTMRKFAICEKAKHGGADEQ